MLLYGLENDQDFQNLDMQLLVSCPAGGSDEGGLFYLDFRRNSWRKLYTGSCSGMVWVRDRLIVTSDDNHLLSFDPEFRVVAKSKHPKLDFHGIAKWDDSIVLIVETAANAIGCYDAATFERVGEIRLNPANKDVHHLNDIWLEGSTLYVSLFSPNDLWILDPTGRNGAIVAIDLTGYRPDRRLDVDPSKHVLVGGLFMPHSVMLRDRQLAYCDSMTFRAVVGESFTMQAAGFTRGLAFADKTVFIGQSRMRHVLRIPHQFSNCGLDGGIYVYDPELRISRFVPLPAEQVYQILVL